MKNDKDRKRSAKQVRALARHWQCCRTEDVAALFAAYDKGQHQTERVATFRLSADAVEELHQLSRREDGLQYIIHLGLHKDYYSETVPEYPPFTLLLQAYHGPDEYQKNCFELEWAANSKFVNSVGASSGENAIPAASAYIFIHSWLEKPTEEIADVFQSIAHEQDLRVQAYIFSNAESKSIFDDMAPAKKKKYAAMDIHLGNGLAVNGHPFAFRPVIEIKDVPKKKDQSTKPLGSTGLEDGEGNSYYDFSHTIPPPPRGV